MIEKYTELKARQAKEFGEFKGIFWAFNGEQFSRGMADIGLTLDDKDLISSLGAGGYILKSSISEFNAMLKRHNEEKNARKKEEQYLFDALVYELNNHEYSYTGDIHPALDALGWDIKDIPTKTLNRAKKEALKTGDL